jgi:hypothetical protein
MRIIAISTEVAEAVRATGKAPGYNHPAFTDTATGYGPCRHCLRTFRTGAEQRTLFTYDPFHGLADLPLPGPVYIHAEPCLRYPEEAGFPDDLRKYGSVLNAYANGGRFLAQLLTDPGEAEARISELLTRPEVTYVEVRDRKAGCFDFRVERG